MYRNIALTPSQVIVIRELCLEAKRKAIKEGATKDIMKYYDILKALGAKNE